MPAGRRRRAGRGPPTTQEIRSLHNQEEPQMIQQYPASAQAPDLQRPDPPVSLRRAVAVMKAGAAVSVIQAITYVVTESATKRAIENGHPRMSASTVNTLAHAGVIIGAVIAVLAIIAFVS